MEVGFRNINALVMVMSMMWINMLEWYIMNLDAICSALIRIHQVHGHTRFMEGLMEEQDSCVACVGMVMGNCSSYDGN